MVRRIFEEMLTIGSPTQIAANLTAEGITTKPGRRRRARPAAAPASTRSICTNCCATASTSASCRTRKLVPWRASADHRPGALGQGSRGAGQDGHARSVETKIGHVLTPCCVACCTPFGRTHVPDLLEQEGTQVSLLRVQVGKPLRRAGQELRTPARAGDRGGGGRPNPHGADQPGIHCIGGAPHPAQRGPDRRGQHGDGDGRLNDVWITCSQSSATASPT